MWRGGNGKETNVHFTASFGNDVAGMWRTLSEIVECKFVDESLVKHPREGPFWRQFLSGCGVTDFFGVMSRETSRTVLGAEKPVLVADFVCPQFEDLLRKALRLSDGQPLVDSKKVVEPK